MAYDMVFTALDGTVTKIRMADDTVHVSNRQDVEPLLEMNARDKINYTGRPKNKDEFHHVARLDMLTYLSLAQQGILEDRERFRKWLNDRDYCKFRTNEAKV